MRKNLIANIKTLCMINLIKYIHHTTHSIGRNRDDLTKLALKLNEYERILTAQQMTINNQNRVINGYQTLYDHVNDKIKRMELDISPAGLEKRAEKLIEEVIDKMDKAVQLERQTMIKVKQ